MNASTTPEVPGQRPRGFRRLPREARVVAVGLGLLGVAAVLVASGVARSVGEPGGRFSWLGWAVAFASVEWAILQVRVLRHAHAVSLSEFVLVLGLVFATPTNLFLGRLLGTLVALLVVRRVG